MISEILRDLNGCFALVARSDTDVIAAVDRMRSIPLFYGTHNGQWMISDEAETVRQFVHDSQCNDIARKEFLLTAYVTGRDTLFPDVKQLQAGEILRIENAMPQKPTLTRYYRFTPGLPSTALKSALREEMNEMHLQVFQRLVNSANGRRIVVPLSGGLDSRLLVTMLKKLKYDNVLCFSYGRQENWEAEISKHVSARLGYEWHFVHYTWKKWRRWFNLSECRETRLAGSNLASRPSIQDWPAVFELRNAGILRDDDLLTPGHSADFLAGSHIPSELATTTKPTREEVVETILKKHYIQWKWQKGNEEQKAQLADRVRRILESIPIESARDAVGAFEMWDWQERQAKYIVNSVRDYERLGFEWRLPFWDSAMMDFWTTVPLQLRTNKQLYDAVLEEGIFAEYGINHLYRDRLAKSNGGASPAEQLLSAQWARATVALYQLSRGAQGRYSMPDRIRTWRTYRGFFGNGLRSLVYPLHVMPVGTYVCLRQVQHSLHQERPKSTPTV